MPNTAITGTRVGIGVIGKGTQTCTIICRRRGTDPDSGGDVPGIQRSSWIDATIVVCLTKTVDVPDIRSPRSK